VGLGTGVQASALEPAGNTVVGKEWSQFVSISVELLSQVILRVRMPALQKSSILVISSSIVQPFQLPGRNKPAGHHSLKMFSSTL
jgi:hypothetical protein